MTYPDAYLSCSVCQNQAGEWCFDFEGYVMTEDGLVNVSERRPTPHNNRKISKRADGIAVPRPKRAPAGANAPDPLAPKAKHTPSVRARRAAAQQATINAWSELAKKRNRS